MKVGVVMCVATTDERRLLASLVIFSTERFCIVTYKLICCLHGTDFL